MPSFILLFLLLIQPTESSKILTVADAAYALTASKVTYDPTYYSIPYPNGDVPLGKGVCTDVVIRAYRAMGKDLQRLVHEDMKANFKLYPTKWKKKSTDTNIDHRRVLNLMVFFERKGKVKPKSNTATDYIPGDIVCWDLGGGITHIGIVSPHSDSKTPLIIHNIGSGQVEENVIFNYKIIGHYSY
jgi:uncharacterized protein